MSSTNTRSDIITRSGQYFNFLDPDQYELSVFDIAHALSNACRFAGQCTRFYSVAEHSVYVSLIVPAEHAFAALFHDAAEAFLGDVSGPLKRLLPDYKQIERRVETSLFHKLGVSYPLEKCIKAADMRLLQLEKRELLVFDEDDRPSYGDFTLPGVAIVGYEPTSAFRLFMNRYFALYQQTSRGIEPSCSVPFV